MPTTTRYLAPGAVSRSILNPLMAATMRLGAAPRGGRLLEVAGRISGRRQTVPVNPLTFDGATYLVAPRGETQWVRNLRDARTGRLRTGRRVDDFTAVELDDADKPPILRAYLERWSAEVGRFFEGLDATSSDDELRAAASGFPVFRVDVSA